MPTGIAIRDPRDQLFDAAERILLRDGPNALTSRAVTTEAGCAKGVLHRHFPDFDAFLADLVRDRIARIATQSAALCESAGTGTVAENVADALTDLFGSVALSILALVTSRDNLRTLLRQTTPFGIPVLTEATTMIASYLTAEQNQSRITPNTDTKTLALTLVGTAHLLLADPQSPPQPFGAVHKVTAKLIALALQESPP